jgi:hypothetical protein
MKRRVSLLKEWQNICIPKMEHAAMKNNNHIIITSQVVHQSKQEHIER